MDESLPWEAPRKPRPLARREIHGIGLCSPAAPPGIVCGSCGQYVLLCPGDLGYGRFDSTAQCFLRRDRNEAALTERCPGTRLIAYGSSLEQIGPIARDVRDCAAVLEAMAVRDVKDSTSVRRKRM